jgi:perosamine synthetase
VKSFLVPLARPDVGGSEREAVARVLASSVLSRGPEVAAFESAIRKRTGAAFAVAVSSGTTALTLGLKADAARSDFRCITSPFSVPASANAVLAAGGEIVFVDIDPDHLAVAPGAVAERLRAGDALLTVHAFGHPAPVAELQALCEALGASHYEDSCEALGTFCSGRHAGRTGRFGSFGFYPNKQITTGEGGVLITDDEALARRVRRLRNHGRSMDGTWLDQQEVGFNGRLSELNAALGVAQLARLDDILDRRRRVAGWYDEELGATELRLPAQRPGYDETSLFAYVVELPGEDAAARRDALVHHLAASGVQAGRYFAPLHLQPGLSDLGHGPGDFPVTERVAIRTVALPFYTTMSRDECALVGRSLRAFLALGRS